MVSIEQSKRLTSALGLGRPEEVFPWQEELLGRMIEGRIPALLDIPTGLGKTSVMAIWLVARACGANLPRRLVYVVDRRAVVDQATEVAVALREWVEQEVQVKEALGLKGRQLPISTLRGRFVDNREWLEDPAAPAIIVGTVDMVGSRLLFEGYGVSRKMRPYHAGLLGADTLLVLDEAHLVPPFEHLLRAITTEQIFRPREEDCARCVPRLRQLALSATGRTTGGEAFALTERDWAHEVVQRRLNARKALRIEELAQGTKLSDALAEQAWRLTGEGKTAVRVIVYSDKPEDAEKAKAALVKQAKRAKMSMEDATELLVGGRRVFEREIAKKRLAELGFLAGSSMERDRPTFLFATSAGEVGIDLDADHMVCDLVAWERMVQRLGRVNRRGGPESKLAEVVVLVEPGVESAKDSRADDGPGEGDEGSDMKQQKGGDKQEQIRRRVAWRKPFTELVEREDGSRDASVGALVRLRARASVEPELEATLAGAISPEPLRPALTLPLVEAWSLTSLKNHPGRPAVQPWLRGWVDEKPQTSVVWRTHLPVRRGGRAVRKEQIEAFFEAAPPHTSEILETETFRVAKWMADRAKEVGGNPERQEGGAGETRLHPEDPVVFVLEPDGSLRRSYSLQELEAGPERKDEWADVIGGRTLIVDSRFGGLRDGRLNEKEFAPPETADGGAWLEEREGGVGFRIRRVEGAPAAVRDGNWRERYRFACEVSDEGEAVRWLAVDKWRNDAATEDDRAEGAPQLLEEHQAWAERRARELADALGLGEYGNVLAVAARLHDEGKRAVHWQRAFHAPSGGVYAKTDGPIRQDVLAGYRHELGSLLRIKEDERLRDLTEEERDLALHLIASHHGAGRPLVRTEGCEDVPPSLLGGEAAEIALRFARMQKKWGPWGLAWWEALLRAADQLASRDNATRGAGEEGA